MNPVHARILEFFHIFEAEALLTGILFKRSALTSKRTLHFNITKINWLMLFKEVIAAYSVNHTEPKYTKYKVTDC
jgi:hypothetical protein